MSQSRLEAVQAGLAELGVSCLVVSALTNVRYLVGFSGSNAALLMRPDSVTLFTDARYREQAIDAPERHVGQGTVAVEFGGDAMSQIQGALVGSDGPVGLEADHLTWAQATALSDDMPASTFVPTSGFIEGFRARKDDDEVAAIRRAASISDAALAQVVADGLAGKSERQVAAGLDARVRELGGDDIAFETIVASGPLAARPHHRPTERRIERGDLVVIDSGTMLDGYRSDMTRSYVIGEPDDQQRLLLEAVREAQAAGVLAAGPGVRACEVDRACRAILEEHGLGAAFSHGTGHGVGLDIHEAPAINARSATELVPGHVITVEPGAYLQGVGGVRWEDTLAITQDGAETLTKAPKQPYI